MPQHDFFVSCISASSLPTSSFEGDGFAFTSIFIVTGINQKFRFNMRMKILAEDSDRVYCSNRSISSEWVSLLLKTHVIKMLT